MSPLNTAVGSHRLYVQITTKSIHARDEDNPHVLKSTVIGIAVAILIFAALLLLFFCVSRERCLRPKPSDSSATRRTVDPMRVRVIMPTAQGTGEETWPYQTPRHTEALPTYTERRPNLPPPAYHPEGREQGYQ